MGADQVGEALVFHGFGLTLSHMAGAEEEASSRGVRKLISEDQATQSSGKRRSRAFFFIHQTASVTRRAEPTPN